MGVIAPLHVGAAVRDGAEEGRETDLGGFVDLLSTQKKEMMAAERLEEHGCRTVINRRAEVDTGNLGTQLERKRPDGQHINAPGRE